MSFARINPFGFSIGQNLSPAQLTQLDIDHANAADKTTANDTIAGIWTVPSGGFTLSGSSSGISLGKAGAMTANVAGAITSSINNSTQLGGGASDWVTFSAARPRTLWVSGADAFTGMVAGVNPIGVVQGTMPLSWQFLSSSPSALNGGMLTSVVFSSAAICYAYYWPIRPLHNGATLSSVTVTLQGATRNSAVLPELMPAVGVFRAGTGAAVSLQSAFSFLQDPTATYASYISPHQIQFVCNQANVIDSTQFSYFLVIWDEGGANSAIANNYLGMSLAYTAIPNMAFP